MFKVQKLNSTGKRYVTVSHGEVKSFDAALTRLSRQRYADGTYRVLEGRKTRITRTYLNGEAVK